MLETISPVIFERLAQRLLRKNDFIQVEVIDKTNDGARYMCDKLKELGLGVKTVLVEQVEIQRQWFLDI